MTDIDKIFPDENHYCFLLVSFRKFWVLTLYTSYYVKIGELSLSVDLHHIQKLSVEYVVPRRMNVWVAQPTKKYLE